MGIVKADFWTDISVWATAAGWNLLYSVLIIIGAIIVSWILRVIIRRVVRQIVSGVKKNQNVTDTQALVASPLAAVRVVQRTRTLGSILSNIVNVTVGVIAIVLIFSVVAPGALSSFALLTAALGAGLGFGAQNIVKDVLNGLFMVMEDQLGVGDVVDLGSATGVVEAVGIRITQVRDVNGTLWFVRNGEILRVGNMSQGWARVIVDLAVPYEADIEVVQAKMMEAATALTANPRWRSRILEKPELWGLESISAEAMVIRIVLKTRTTARDDVSRELRARLKQAMGELGVKLPSLSAVVLSGFDSAGSVAGANPPRTRPTQAVSERPTRGRRARTAAKRGTPAGPGAKQETPATGSGAKGGSASPVPGQKRGVPAVSDPGAIRIHPAIETPPMPAEPKTPPTPPTTTKPLPTVAPPAMQPPATPSPALPPRRNAPPGTHGAQPKPHSPKTPPTPQTPPSTDPPSTAPET